MGKKRSSWPRKLTLVHRCVGRKMVQPKPSEPFACVSLLASGIFFLYFLQQQGDLMVRLFCLDACF